MGRVTTQDRIGPEHPALCAWQRLDPNAAWPDRIDLLKERRTSRVYRLVGAGPGRSSLIAKRNRLAKLVQETRIYRELLPEAGIPTLACHGLVAEADGDLGWMFLEDAGETAFGLDAADNRMVAARWLARLHGATQRLSGRLPERGPQHYLEQLRIGRETIHRHADNPALGTNDHQLLDGVVGRLDLVERGWGRIEEACDGTPRSLVHGDFARRNLRTIHRRSGNEPLVFDWGAAGYGLPGLDLLQVDLESYASEARQYWPDLDRDRLERQLWVSRLFRGVLAPIKWRAASLGAAWVVGPLRDLAAFVSRLDDLIASGWPVRAGRTT